MWSCEEPAYSILSVAELNDVFCKTASYCKFAVTLICVAWTPCSTLMALAPLQILMGWTLDVSETSLGENSLSRHATDLRRICFVIYRRYCDTFVNHLDISIRKYKMLCGLMRWRSKGSSRLYILWPIAIPQHRTCDRTSDEHSLLNSSYARHFMKINVFCS